MPPPLINHQIFSLPHPKNKSHYQLCCSLRKRCTNRYICSNDSPISLKLFAPVITIFPETKIKKAILGLFSLYTNPGNSSGIN